MMKLLAFSFLIAVTGSFAAQGQNTPEDQVKVLTQIKEINQKEIHAGQLAQEKATRNDIRSFGKHLVDDHSNLNDRVAKYAQEHKLALAETNPPRVGDLDEALGKDFDRKFVDEMIKGHRDALNMVMTAKNDTSNASFKSFLGSLIPNLQQHETTAKGLEKKLPGNG